MPMAEKEKALELPKTPPRLPVQIMRREKIVTDDSGKPPRVLPNTYWTRKGGGWVLEFKRKIKHRWQYEYYGLLKLDTWDNLKQEYQDEKLKVIIKGIISAKRSELQRARNSRSSGHRLRLVGERG